MPHPRFLSGCENVSYTHGHAARGNHSRTYTIWEGLKKRCLSPNCKAFKDYGGRGITVCDRWLSFQNFLDDMGECPPGATIERKNNDLGYFPENCVWADRTQQCRNRRNTRVVEAFGRTQTIQEWADEYGLTYYTLYLRIRKGVPPEEALKKPRKGAR